MHKMINTPRKRQIAGIIAAVMLVIGVNIVWLTTPFKGSETSLRVAARQGDVNAMLATGAAYQYGAAGFEESEQKALQYYAAAAESGSAEGAWNAHLVAAQVGKNEDSVKYLYYAGSRGIIQAQVAIARMLISEPESRIAGLAILATNASKRDSESMFQIGRAFFTDLLPDKSGEEPFFWYSLAWAYETDMYRKQEINAALLVLSKKINTERKMALARRVERYRNEVLLDNTPPAGADIAAMRNQST